MTPEEDKELQAHVEAIAGILYRNTDPLELKTIEGIEQVVRQQMLKHISPQIGIFLSKKQRGQQQVELES